MQDVTARGGRDEVRDVFWERGRERAAQRDRISSGMPYESLLLPS